MRACCASSFPQVRNILAGDGPSQLVPGAGLELDENNAKSSKLVDAGGLAEPKGVLLDSLDVEFLVGSGRGLDCGSLAGEGGAVRVLITSSGRRKGGTGVREERLNVGVGEKIDDRAAAGAVAGGIREGGSNECPGAGRELG